MVKQEIKKDIVELIKQVTDDKSLVIKENAQLIGENRILDSITLVELCLKLEDLSSKYNFEFDWTSDETLSANRSMFRSVETLVEEFIRQKDKVVKL